MDNKNKSRIEDIFLTLLRAGLWGTTPDPALFVNLGRKEWGALLQMAQKQAVLGLVYAGISRLPKERMPESQLLLRLYGFVEQIRKQNAHIDKVAQEICSWLEAEGLEPMVLKGRSVGAFYADPDIRQSGDIDLFFHRDYERVVSIVQRSGIEVELDANHDKFWYQGILIELHARPFRPLYPLTDPDYSPMTQEINGRKIRTLNLKANALLLLLHPAKHFMKEGLGWRQVCDWAAFQKHYAGRPELDEAVAEMERQGAGRFVRAFCLMSERCLGAGGMETRQTHRAETERDAERMLRLVMSRGNFGAEGKHWRNGKEWWKYYWDLWCYIWRVYPFWKAYFRTVMPRRIGHRIYRIIEGKKLDTK